MVETFDAASRLAEGRPAVDAVQDYVWACHLLGFQDPDLTLHASQVRDWYGSEDGIDLRALDADCEALRAAAAAAEELLARQDVQLASMSAVWRGAGAQASRDFLRRHGEMSADVVNAVRVAAESLAALRDRLWHSVDRKVAATIATQDRGARPDWRAAAETVNTGAGDRAVASELVDQEVKPFVDNEIRSEWLAAMRSAMAAVVEAYDAAADELTSKAVIPFDVPGDFGPSWLPTPGDGVATEPAGVSSSSGTVAAGPVGAVAPGGAGTPAGTPPAWSAPPAAAQLSTPLPSQPPPPPVDPAAMTPPSLPSMGGGMPDMGSGLSGFGGQLGDLLGGLMGTSQDALSDLPGPDELDKSDDLDPLDEDGPEDEEDEEDEESEEDEEDEEDEEAEEAEEADAVESETAEADHAADAAGAPVSEESPPEPSSAAVEPVPPPTPAPPPIEPLAEPAPARATGTPCEIAADELPQVGQ